MEEKLLAFYLQKFQKIRRDRSHGGAPHKPVLLLSIIELIEENVIYSNRIYITPQLVAKFRDIWNLLVTTPHQPNFALPFFHMRSEGFWHLINKPGFEIALTKSNSIRSFSNLKAAVNYATFDNALFQILQRKEKRELFKIAILEQYFPDAKTQYDQVKSYSLFKEVELEILNEDPEVYKAKLEQLEATLADNEYEEQKFIRSGAFRDQVLKTYNATCSISGLRIATTENISLIDACHIKPFNLSGNDHITNGFALCPNLHRAFDRGLISISDDYKVLISPHFMEYDHNVYSIRQFEGKELILPGVAKYLPDSDNFHYHRANVFLL